MIDIEKTIIQFINQSGLAVQAYADVPNPRPASFITVERTGGNITSQRVDHPQVAIQCWAQDRLAASVLAYNTRELLQREFINEFGVKKVYINSFFNYPDQTGNVARYQIVMDLITV